MTRSASPAATYQRDEVLTASPLRLVLRVFGAAISALQRARRHAEGGDRVRCRAETSRARGLVAELLGALDKEQGGEIAGQLEALYVFILTQLLGGRASPNPRALADAERILDTLREGFDAILRNDGERRDS
ncbi:MAG: flagellar protein FliS [Planctomycetes bacterium]|nr:flagellar protein FliS [Planctomycetota bacterium]